MQTSFPENNTGNTTSFIMGWGGTPGVFSGTNRENLGFLAVILVRHRPVLAYFNISVILPYVIQFFHFPKIMSQGHMIKGLWQSSLLSFSLRNRIQCYLWGPHWLRSFLQKVWAMVIRGRVAPQPLKNFERISSNCHPPGATTSSLLALGAKHSKLCVLHGWWSNSPFAHGDSRFLQSRAGVTFEILPTPQKYWWVGSQSPRAQVTGEERSRDPREAQGREQREVGQLVS